MPRAGVQELVYVLVTADEQGLGTVEVHGTRSQAEFAAEAVARSEGYTTKGARFHGTGELICVKKFGVTERAVRTGIFVLPRQILRKPRVLKEKQ